MCGICGIWGDSQSSGLDRMLTAMHHRGPDDRGSFRDHQVALGMTRLAVIDLSSSAHQPMSNADGSVWIIYNGETYNFAEERRILEARGHAFRSASDTEVILTLYQEYGDDFLRRLRGMFALAIYDRRDGIGRERLLLARDHFGVKPLLFARFGGSRVIFASEIKGLLASGLVRPEVDPAGLRQLLTFGAVRQPRTILRGVEMLLPGHRMIIEGSRVRIERYWSLTTGGRPEFGRMGHADRVTEMTRVLEEATRLQMVSDVPLGAFLSGGIDSTLLVTLMARQVSRPLRTFSVGFEEEGADIDESGVAAVTARLVGTDHCNVRVRATEVRDQLSNIAAALDQPSVDGVNSYFVSRAARQGVTVAVSGVGGDELFAGYPWWFESMLREEAHNERGPWKARAKHFVAALAALPSLDRLSLTRIGTPVAYAREFETWASRFAARNCVCTPAQVARLMTPALREASEPGRSYDYDFASADELADAPPLERITGLCVRSYLSDQLLRDIDAVSMAQSLEVRVPFLDPLVADTALSLPPEEKLDGAGTGLLGKRILRDILDRLVPEHGMLPGKRGFNMPFPAWLRGGLRETLMDVLTSARFHERGFLARSEAVDVAERFLRGDATWSQPWILMMFELWCAEVLDRAGDVVAPQFVGQSEVTRDARHD